MKKNLTLVLIIISLSASSFSGDAEILALVGGTVIDVSDFGRSQSDLKQAVILVEGEKITAVGSKDSIKIPKNARVINIEGKYVLPGLIDGFAALDNQAYANAYLYMGVTSIIGISGYRRSPIFENADPSPHIYRFAGIGSFASETDKMLAEIDEVAKKGVKVLLLHYRITPEQLKLAVKKAHELGLATIGELGDTSYYEAIKFGVDAFVHYSRYSVELAPAEMKAEVAEQPFSPASKRFRSWLADLNPEDQRVKDYAKILGSSGVGLMPTLSLYCIDLPSLENPWNEPAASILDPKDIHYPLDQSTGQHNFEPNVLARFIKEAKNALMIEQKYYEAEAKHLAGSGTDIFGTMPGISLHQELELLTKAGLTEREALASATWNFSEIFKWKEAGQIKPGCQADIVITDKNPLENIKNLKQISMVILRGKIIDREKLLTKKGTVTKKGTGPFFPQKCCSYMGKKGACPLFLM